MSLSHSGSKNTNKLIHSTSPYLLQHAHNPVDWHEWAAEALDKARVDDKPILVSIGYSSCHWCHVMERESFENDDIAAMMNEYFVCIKVDREERPDIDQIYMDAVQAMGINGGWPLNVFLTPEQKPFFGGTYFNPQVWVNVLRNIHHAYINKKNEIQQSADELTKILSSNDSHRFISSTPAQKNLTESLQKIYQHLESRFDTAWGGLNKAPKFIMPSLWLWLLRYYSISKNQQALDHINLTLTKIIDGGIYDQTGGGFSRYSVDAEWFAPHFEKMLYDNAQLISLYAEAFALTENSDYKRVVYETVDWLKREMTHPENGFYSALDADSEGIEGKFYTWTKSEIETILGEDAEMFCSYYGVTNQGNWEHGRNILKRVAGMKAFAQQRGITVDTLKETLKQSNQKLLTERDLRIKPGLDDKVLAGWNAMMISGLVDAFHALGDDKFLNAAVEGMRFMETNLMDDNRVYRVFKNKRSSTEGFLEDYAYVIKAFIKLYQADFNEQWLFKAEKLTYYTIENFFDTTDNLFFYTSAHAEKLLTRKKELFDNVIPSSNSVMAMNLHHLGIMLDNEKWKDMAEKMINQFNNLIESEPNYMSNWAIAALELQAGMAEVAIVGKDATQLKNAITKNYLPFSLFMGTVSQSDLPLLRHKATTNKQTTIFVCRNYTCQQPVYSVDTAISQILNKS